MNCGARASALLACCALVVACQDPAQAPIPLTVTSDLPATTVGAVVTLTSDQFSGLALQPRPDTLRPNRWTNFAVVVGADTADSWRLGPNQIAFRVPPILTGNYDVSITATGYDEARASLFAVGLAYPLYWGGLYAYTNVSQSTVLPGRGVLVAEATAAPGLPAGYGVVDVQDRQLHMPMELRQGDSNRVRMYVPGPTYRAGYFILDRSPSGSGSAQVWKADPWTLAGTIPCGVVQGQFTAAELSPTTCLSENLGVVVRNGTDTVVANFFNAPFGEFRLAPGGKWAVIRTELWFRESRGAWLPMIWPVFNKAGAIAYTIDTLFHVTGAAFSSAGDTMFLTTSVRDTTAPNGVVGRFSLSLYETATGRFLRSRPFAATRALQDVALDPVRPILYVGGIEREPSGHLRQYLTVLDRHTLDIIADMPAPGRPYFSAVGDATLVYDGSAGRVSVIGLCGFDCGGLWVFTFDLP